MSEAAVQPQRAKWGWAGVSLVGVIGAVVGIALYVHFRDRADAFAGGEGVHIGYHGPRMATIYADPALSLDGGSSGHRVIAVRSVAPVITVNTSRATVRVLVCLPRKGPIGAVFHLGPFCQQVRQFSAGPVDLGNYHAQIVLAITPHRPGVLRIEGCRVTYADGPHVGTQQTGSEVVVRTRAPNSRRAPAG